MNEKEKSNREKLRERKPKVLEKIIAQGTQQIPRIQLQADYKCNMKCQHCSIENVRDNTKQKLTIPEIKNLFEQAHDMGISRMTLSGGEPLSFSNLDEMILAINPELFWIQLDTNGLLLTKERIQHLRELGVDCIAPSLDSLNVEEHNNFRRTKDAAESVLASIDMIKEAGFSIFVQTVVTKTRLYSNEFIEFLKYFKNKDVGVFVSFAKPVGAFTRNFQECITSLDLKYFETLEKEYNVFSHLTPAYSINEERKCVAAKNIFGITAHGDCIPCIYFYCSLGNIREEPLIVIYDRMRKLNIFDRKTCPMADVSDTFMNDYLVNVYDKKLPVSWKQILTEKDFNK
jgi:MoaA/NifB/PqqE/SkfB family radical SAM enzyme